MTATQGQKQQIFGLLQRDKVRNFYFLQRYLQAITRSQAVDFVINDDLTISLSPADAWEVIVEWGRSAEGNLPVDARGQSRVHLASKLHSYIASHIVGNTSEAAAARVALIEQANRPVVPAGTSAPALDSYQKAQALRRQLENAINAKFMGRLTTELEKAKFLQRIPDVRTRSMVAALLAGNAANLRQYTEYKDGKTSLGFSDLPERINQILLARAGDRETNMVIHLAHSEAVERGQELQEVSQIIDREITTAYSSDKEFLEDQSRFRALPSLAPTLSDIPALIDHLAPNATRAQRASMAAALRKEIILSARGQHRAGRTIISKAFSAAGLGGDPSALANLEPVIEELQTSIRQQYLGNTLFEKDPRTLATYDVAAETGVNPLIPWAKEQDIQSMKKALLEGTGFTDLDTAIAAESDPVRYGRLRNVRDMENQYFTYRGRLAGSPLLAAQDALAKTRGNFAIARQPYDRMVHKIWKAQERVDDIIHWPARKYLDTVDKLIEKTTIIVKLKNGRRLAIPLLRPVAFLTDQWIGWQKGVALGVFKWSHKLTLQNKWYSPFTRQIADFSKGFFKSDASWGRAGFLFVERKWGNVTKAALDWTAQKVFKQGSWAALKATLGASIKAFAMKIAPAITMKISTYLAETLAGIGSGGWGLILLAAQILWDLAKFAVNWVKKFFTDGRFREKLINLLPITLPFALLAALPMFLISGGSFLLGALVAGIAAMLFSLAAVFVSAFVWSFSIIVVGGLLTFFVNTTINLDSSAAQLVANVICAVAGESGETGQGGADTGGGGNAALRTASCIHKILTDCGINPLTSSNANSSRWQCTVAQAALVAAGALEELKRSATSYDVLQCVGLIASVDIALGGSGGFGNAKDLETNKPGNYQYVSGVGNCRPGDFFVDKNGDWGHTGVFVSNAGPYIKCIDANGGGPGVVRDSNSCVWPTDKIAGCLKRS